MHSRIRSRIRETHISWVVLTGAFAYKIKKPVKFDFIDASTLERRLHHCNEELRLNRRLAPDLYLDVVPIARVDGRVRVGGSSGSVIDFAPHLRWIDVISDVAFLVMDLVSRSRADLAAAVLSRYLEVTGDYEGLPLLPFYAVYRALVRAKVDAITAAQSA